MARRYFVNERHGLRYERVAPHDLAGGQHNRPERMRLDDVGDLITLDAISGGQKQSKIRYVRHAAQPTEVVISRGAAVER
ncbi:hypothetical protein Acy02nite_57830 [Actinoplanes cyaneus]|uniref:Uncharacterized protein n=1 Tax=Actinoplanes cyaneus TaxID=52696 RepID=A0A919IME8_9ACTN|nr:hypothetical protein Acy02nite_57830 [Actinoplanes cyaneus]